MNTDFGLPRNLEQTEEPGFEERLKFRKNQRKRQSKFDRYLAKTR